MGHIGVGERETSVAFTLGVQITLTIHSSGWPDHNLMGHIAALKILPRGYKITTDNKMLHSIVFSTTLVFSTCFTDDSTLWQ